MRLGSRTLWSEVDLRVAEGEFLAVLGPNGTGKTTLLKVLLGLVPLSAGTVRVNGAPPRRGNHELGYVPQQQAFDRSLPIRGRDLVRFGIDGHHWGLPRRARAIKARVDDALRAVGASAYADAPVGLLSGGEQQRLRIAQALLGDPKVLLCDEPLLALDLASQRGVTHLIDERRRQSGTPVVFVTHEVNPVLPYVDRILYLVRGKWAIGPPEEILTSEQLSDLYGIEVDVIKVRDRYLVVERGGRASHRTGRARPPRARALMGIGYFLQFGFAQHALEAAFLVAVSCGLIGPFVITRTMSFAVHGTSELAFTGAVAGLLVADNPLAGALVGALIVAALIGLLGQRATERDSTIGVILAAGLGLGVFLLGYYHGYASEALNILFGNIFGISSGQIILLGVIAVLVAIVLTVIRRPLLFASVDPDVARANGVPTGVLGIVFLFILAITVTEAAQIVGTLLVLSLAITPAAAAQRLSANPFAVSVLSVAMAVLAADGGILLSFQFPTVKPSVLIVAISFAFYVVARLVGPAIASRRRDRLAAPELAELTRG